MSKPWGLGKKLLTGWMLQTLAIISLFSVAMHESTEWMEKSLVSDMLHDELTLLIQDYESGEDILLPPSIHLYGQSLGLPNIPPTLQNIPEGFKEIVTKDDSYFVYKLTTGDLTYVLVRDQYDFEQSEQLLKAFIIGSSFLILLLSLGLGVWWTQKRIMTPIKTLSSEVKKVASAAKYEPLKGEISNDEIGELAQTCDRALERFHSAIERERLFTADISHELRTPLTVIQTSAELAQLADSQNAKLKYFQQIEQACSRMDELITVFLQLARDESFVHTAHHDRAGEVMREVIEIWEPIANAKKLELISKVRQICYGHYSPILLGVVLNNLIKNAVSYTTKGHIRVTELSDGFEICDTGPGIANKDRELIFSPFTRATDLGSGNGMGLSIASRICQRSGWSLTLVNCPSGTKFKLTLTNKQKQEPMDLKS